MEERTARDWYWWLWLSPLLTVPTSLFLGLAIRGLLQGGLYDDRALQRTSSSLAVSLSSLWHLILLVPTLDKRSEFVRWHGRQALLLAVVRTAVPLGFVLAFGFDLDPALLAFAILIAIWFFGTLLGQMQAARGKCSLARWFGRADALPSRVDVLVDVIRFSQDPGERGKALLELKELGMVEPL